MQVGSTDSLREAGCRRIVTSFQSDCDERSRAAAEQFLSLRRISPLTTVCVDSFRNAKGRIKARATHERGHVVSPFICLFRTAAEAILGRSVLRQGTQEAIDAEGHCFLSLRQFKHRPSEAILAPRRKYVSGGLRGEFCGYSHELDSKPSEEQPI
jgi:hypothetical protein